MNSSLLPSNQLPLMRFLSLILGIVVAFSACADNPPVVYPTVAPFDETKLRARSRRQARAHDLLRTEGSQGDLHARRLRADGSPVHRHRRTPAARRRRTSRTRFASASRTAISRIPIVSLTVVEINSLKCSVFGQVARSGTIKFTPGMTITEAIAQSGGFSPLARKNMVKVTRLLNGKKETYKIPVEMIAEGERPNFPMMPGDEVFVPERPW